MYNLLINKGNIKKKRKNIGIYSPTYPSLFFYSIYKQYNYNIWKSNDSLGINRLNSNRSGIMKYLWYLRDNSP